MKRLALLCCLVTGALSSSAIAGNPAAHIHGTASLQLASDGNTLTLQLDTPLEKLLGFERAPHSEKQKQAVRAMAEVLTPSPAARCTPMSVEFASPVRQAVPLPAGDRHADLAGNFLFRCASPAALRDIEVGLFQTFPKLYRVDVQVAVHAGNPPPGCHHSNTAYPGAMLETVIQIENPRFRWQPDDAFCLDIPDFTACHGERIFLYEGDHRGPRRPEKPRRDPQGAAADQPVVCHRAAARRLAGHRP
ncbi:MAG: DUF2796 domain-containing protein [Candidatus Accumulibacter sp.]|uniref:ZrgA family zinc uptake protein n=1 Tax=Accumulibacter sp. TaxID=2053492 RepID=UPI001A3C52CA|nr:DUF2796 domain-containing protein [Accumulibacter sp.]MBL8394476.1 DUF2796 domain-containing protein [Accumulibacter sp.]